MGSQPLPVPAPPREVRAILDDLRVLVRALRVSSRQAEVSVGLSGAQLFVLQTLAEAGDRGLSLRDLARLTQTDPSSVSVVAARLVEQGLAARKVSPDDARRAELRLTDRGKRSLRRAPSTVQTALVTGLLEMPRGKRSRLHEGLRALVTSLGLADRPTMFFEDDGEEPRRAARPTRRARS